MADILVVKGKGLKLEASIKSQGVSGNYAPVKYKKQINFRDFRDLALFLHDLNLMFNAPVEKAIAEFRKKKEIPFW